MITLITGLPGNGKTLYAIDWLRKKAEKEARTVYYSGITDVKVPGWIEGDPEKWMDLPKGSIILIDEVQRVMRPRQHGTKVPEFVAALETHRHKGVDLVLITQHPMLLDSNVRRLVGQHFHIIRKFGTKQAVVHEWNAVKENCDKNREDSIQHHFGYPAEVFALYKSAELHTHKRRIPGKVWLLLVLPFVLAAVAWFLYDRVMSKTKPATGQEATMLRGAAAPPGAAGPAAAKLTPVEYVAQFSPRVAGLAYTAPVYDEVTKPVIAPYPAACIASAARCSCYTQQGTALDTPPALCRSIATGGFFVAWAQPMPPPPAWKSPEASKPADLAPSQSQATFMPHTPKPSMPAVSVVNPPADNPGRGKHLPPVSTDPNPM